MDARERRVVDTAYSISCDSGQQEPGESRGPLMAIQVSIAARRYRRQLHPLVEERNSTIVNGRLAGNDFAQPMESLASGMLFDFPPEAQDLAKRRIQALEKVGHEVAETVAVELLDEIAIRTAGVQHLHDKIFDKRQLLQEAQIELVIVPPEDPETPKRLFETEQSLAVAYSTLGRWRAAFALAVAQIVAVFSMETTLVFLSLTPILAGTPGVVPWMIVAQAIVLSSGLLFLGHLLWSSSQGLRWLAAIALAVISIGLAVIRGGVVVNAAGAEPQDFMAWVVIGVMSLSGLVLAVIGGQAFHRAQRTAAKASSFREERGGDIADMEADLAEWKAGRAHRRNREKELTRLVPRLEQDISRLESRLQSQTAETRQLVQRRVRETASRRLSNEISNTARQLAVWRHDPNSARTGPTTVRSIAAIVLGLTAFAGAACTPPDHVQVENMLVDTSGSINPDVAERMRMRVLDAAQHWIRTANPGDEFALWWLTPEGSPYPADRKTLTMPVLRVPAYASRDAFANEAVSILEDWLDELPRGVQRTRLLEAIYFIGSTEDRRWAISILSDLREDSPNWDSISGNVDDAGLLKAMLELCPTVKIPPAAVSLLSWPGLINGSGGIKEHENARQLFTRFFELWAPEAEVRVMSI